MQGMCQQRETIQQWSERFVVYESLGVTNLASRSVDCFEAVNQTAQSCATWNAFSWIFRSSIWAVNTRPTTTPDPHAHPHLTKNLDWVRWSLTPSHRTMYILDSPQLGELPAPPLGGDRCCTERPHVAVMVSTLVVSSSGLVAAMDPSSLGVT